MDFIECQCPRSGNQGMQLQSFVIKQHFQSSDKICYYDYFWRFWNFKSFAFFDIHIHCNNGVLIPCFAGSNQNLTSHHLYLQHTISFYKICFWNAIVNRPYFNLVFRNFQFSSTSFMQNYTLSISSRVTKRTRTTWT